MSIGPLRPYPHGEDHNATAGGDTSELRRSHNRPIAFSAGPALGNSPASPPGENKNFNMVGNTKTVLPGQGTGMGKAFRGDGTTLVRPRDDEIENLAAEAGLPEPGELPAGINFLQLVREAENQAARYVAQINKRAWSQSMRAYNNEHFLGSKYTKTDWRNRSNIFRPKTRSAVRKDMAAVAASLFGNIDAVNCVPGNEGDIRQRGAAAVMEELVNYRTDRSSGKASMPWFPVAMGARQDALITGICLSKQSWKLELRKAEKPETYTSIEEDGEEAEKTRDIWLIDIDRPDTQLVPPENVIIDPAADWTNPIQSAAYVILKWPMQVQEILQKQESPVNPWEPVSYSQLLANTDSGTTDTSAIRRARELGIDRYDETQTGRKFQIVWVYEVYMRVDGKDYTFLSCGDRAFLTKPKLVREVYPEQFGERPLTMGYGHLDAHRLFPMSPVESWQQYQIELNEIANLVLDATKQNVMPISKVRRGRQVDLDQVKRRTSGSSIMVQEPDDVTWEQPPSFPQQVAEVTRELELEFDDLAGQFNGQTAENNNALSRTLGGLKLVSGSANAVQEFDIRVWIETWAQPTLAQIVRLEQYYEHDDVVLGICGDRAGLFKKYGISEIDDDLLEQEIVVRVSVGLGAGDPAQRLMKFGQALQMAMPIAQAAPAFQRGEIEVDVEAIFQEIFGDAGFRDGGARFFKKGQPKQDPLMPLKEALMMAKIDRDKKSGNAAMLTALSAAAKVALGNRELDAAVADQIAQRQLDALGLGFDHGHRTNEMTLSAADHGHRHGLAIRAQGHQESLPQPAPGGGGNGSKPPPSAPAAPPAAPPGGGMGAAFGGPPPAQPTSQAALPAPGAGGAGGGPPNAAPQGPQPVTSYMSQLATAEPAPPRDEAPTPTQQALSGMRQASNRYYELIKHPETGEITGIKPAVFE
jgi:hypothetical protein